MATKYVDREGLAYYNQKLLEIIGTKANTSDVDETVARIDEAIAASNAAIADTIAALNTLRGNTELSIADLQSKDLEIDNEISNLKTKDIQQDTEISDLKTKDTQHESSIADLIAKDTELDTDITNLQTRDIHHDNQITNLSTIKADKTAVTQEIDDAIRSVTQFDYEIVDELPTTGVKGVIYLMLYDSGPHGNIYQEWIWLPTRAQYETLGSTNQVNLDNYVTFDDLAKITNREIENMFD